MVDYNSTFFDIVTRLELCGVKIIDTEMLEKNSPHFMLSISYCNSNIDNEDLKHI